MVNLEVRTETYEACFVLTLNNSLGLFRVDRL